MKYTKETKYGQDWIVDENNNRWSITCYRDEKECKRLLKTLERCSDCSSCSDCSDCSSCSSCSRCSSCSSCLRCSSCSSCSRCSDMQNSSPQKQELKEIPIIPNIHKAVYEAVSKPNALNMERWHTCETTHCRAGWVVHLAGKEGYELEKKTSSVFAAMQIYEVSGYLINPCRFHDANNTALEDMKRLAEGE